jgi:AP-1 complex subunit beta-1
MPRLAHENPAVILSAVKVILKFMENVSNPELEKTLVKKLAAPLLTLLNTVAEI